MVVQSLAMTCDKCKVKEFCSSKGSSPFPVGKKKVFCQIVGGYGRVNVRPEILSNESKELYNKNGPCLTIAEVPMFDEYSRVTYKIEKIFSPPNLHEREKVGWHMDMMYPRAYTEK